MYGDLYKFTASPSGRGQFHFSSRTLQVWELIGRSLVIHEELSLPGKRSVGSYLRPNTFSSFFSRVACGIIARSSGLFQNDKKICACDGIVLWDERDHPVAGINRKDKIKQSSSAQL
jgi:copper chaperone for superoxide dismutase